MDIKEIIVGLITADRSGTDEDIPEGSRYVQLSDTLVQEMVECLKEHVNEPVIKVYNHLQ
jgi:hypothetical protein